MTVADLIDELKKLPLNDEVRVSVDYFEEFVKTEIVEVTHEKDTVVIHIEEA
jgi:hypothetical protein